MEAVPSTAATRRTKSHSTARTFRTRERTRRRKRFSAPPRRLWFKDQLRRSTATWKIWGNSEGAPDWRSDPQNLPPALTKETWPKTTYALMSSGGLWIGLSGARRDIRPSARRENYGLRDCLRRPAQLLGGLRDVGVAAGQVRSCRPEFRRRIAFECWHHGSVRA